jgi:hypothetical protein
MCYLFDVQVSVSSSRPTRYVVLLWYYWLLMNFTMKSHSASLYWYFQNFQLLVAKIERDAVWWLHETVPRMYRPSAAEFVHALHKVI